MSLPPLQKPLRSAAPGNYLGYSLQQLRACHHLLKSEDGSIVSLEHFDDVAVHRADGSLLLEQCKSALSGNPVADRSDELWKTLANWSETCPMIAADPANTIFRIYVSPVKSGSLVKQMAEAGSAEAKPLLRRIEKLLSGTKKPACSANLERFLQAGEKLCLKIIERFEFLTDDDPTLKVLEYARLMADEAASELASACVGMAVDRLDKLVRQKKPAAVDCTAFRRQVRTFASRSNLSNLVATPPPTDAAVTTLANQDPLFLRQLHAVGFERRMLLAAVGDYLRANADKTFWAEEGRVLEASIVELDRQMMRRHAMLRDEVEDVHVGRQPHERGRRLYRRCAESPMTLESAPLPPHFVAGEFNHLAQSRDVGWHPSYESLFPKDSD